MSASTLLGGLPPATFLKRHWQKRPLLVRQAIPGFTGLIDRDVLLGLATRGDVTSRLVIEHHKKQGARWERHDGPFGALDVGMLPRSHWTVLVHGLETLVPGCWELLRGFGFLPAARIDDLMVSHAADGGSVGPHVDDYDVFLLQGPGRRRWQISTQKDLETDPRAAIKVLADFRAEDEWLLEPGDMLYLPPGVAHHGVADGPCFTYSIGFLAPSHLELAQSFLGWLAGAVAPGQVPSTLYADPDLKPATDRLEIGDAMVKRVAQVLGGVRWDKSDVEHFLGCFLTRPKPQVIFETPTRAVDRDGFARRLRGRGRLTLALPSRGLVRGERVFLNGEGHTVKQATREAFHVLADTRTLALPATLDAQGVEILHAAYLNGWLGVTA